MKYLTMLITIFFFSFGFKSIDQNKNRTFGNNIDQPKELGKVNWFRNIEEGVRLSKSLNKPIFLLFQEVPGCSTCQQYGQSVLSHPLIVEAIETEFVPVAIFNNNKGKDAAVLKYFGEPAWNNPVVRIIGDDKKDVVNRIAGNYSELVVVTSMKTALNKYQIPVPEYFNILEREFIAKQNGLEEATVSMYCFWTGEKKLAELPGVVETQPGFMGGKEVVQIKYDSQQIDYKSVLKFAKAKDCASHVFTNNQTEMKTAKGVVGNSTSSKSNFRIDGEPKYYLSKTEYQYIPMSSLQAVLVNAEIGKGSNPEFLLSPRQLEYHEKSDQKKSLINVPIIQAWSWN